MVYRVRKRFKCLLTYSFSLLANYFLFYKRSSIMLNFDLVTVMSGLTMVIFYLQVYVNYNLHAIFMLVVLMDLSSLSLIKSIIVCLSFFLYLLSSCFLTQVSFRFAQIFLSNSTSKRSSYEKLIGGLTSHVRLEILL